MAAAGNEDLFSSVVSEIKAYRGKDPLCPWLRGIRRMREFLPRKTLAEKLPRFLQRCAEAFESDRRYRSDIRYLRVWFQLMDHVDDPRALLRRMEKNQIGVKQSAFYVAYSLFYEKQKKFEAAEKMYLLGAQRLAEPPSELQKSYEQFRRRVELHNRQKSKAFHYLSLHCFSIQSISSFLHYPKLCFQLKEANCNHKADEPKYLITEVKGQTEGVGGEMASQRDGQMVERDCKEYDNTNTLAKKFTGVELNVDSVKPGSITNEDTVVVKFVDSAIVGQSTAEDACHHGLVDPTVNMKEAMNAINSMFREPLDVDLRPKRKVQQNIPQTTPQNSNEFEIFVDDPPGSNPPGQSNFDIFVDHDLPRSFIGGFNDDDGGDDDDDDSGGDGSGYAREDTVVCRFVGSTIAGDRAVENACHSGLVDPTVNLKEAIDDINSMFGKPIDFVRARRQKREGCPPVHKQIPCQQEFSILVDDDVNQQVVSASDYGGSCVDAGLFEPTMFTKEAMNDINDLFSRPLDF